MSLGERYVADGEARAEEGMRVYEAVSAEGGERVRVYELTPEAESGFAERFLRLARAAMPVEHPYLARILEVVEEEEARAVVVEAVAGQPLVAAGSEPHAVIPLALQALDGLSAAHAAGLVHGHIDPHALLKTHAGSARLCGLGVWDVPAAPPASAVAYMAPEQLAGEPLTPQSDLFSLGAVLYRALSGRGPFDAPDAAAAAANVTSAQPVALAPMIGAPLAGVIERALAKDPHGRFASAQEFATQLMLAPLPTEESAGAPKRPSAVSLALSRARRLARGRLKLAVAGVVLVALVAGVAVGAQAYTRRKNEEQRQRVLAEAEAVAVVRDEAYALRKELKDCVGALKQKAARNRTDVASWDASWRRRLDDYNERRAEVRAHNEQETARHEASRQTFTTYDWWGYATGSYDYYSYTASYWREPSYPSRPSPVRADLRSEQQRLSRVVADLRSLKARMPRRLRVASFFSPAATDLDAVVTKLLAEAQADDSQVRGLVPTGEQGDVVDQAAVARLRVDDEAALAQDFEQRFGTILNRFSLLSTDYAQRSPIDVSKLAVPKTSKGKPKKVLADRNPATGWASTVGEADPLAFALPKTVRFSSIVIASGSVTPKWGRPKRIRLSFDGGASQVLELKNANGEQRFDIVPLVKSRTLKVQVLEVFGPGKKEAVIGELRPKGYE